MFYETFPVMQHLKRKYLGIKQKYEGVYTDNYKTGAKKVEVKINGKTSLILMDWKHNIVKMAMFPKSKNLNVIPIKILIAFQK